jgi:hypothetical protein
MVVCIQLSVVADFDTPLLVVALDTPRLAEDERPAAALGMTQLAECSPS